MRGAQLYQFKDLIPYYCHVHLLFAIREIAWWSIAVPFGVVLISRKNAIGDGRWNNLKLLWQNASSISCSNGINKYYPVDYA